MMIATLNAVLMDGGKDDIIAITVVENEHEGELWFNENKPDNGTQVDYALHSISEVFAAPGLLDACKMMLRLLEGENLDEKFDGEAEVLRDAITKAEL